MSKSGPKKFQHVQRRVLELRSNRAYQSASVRIVCTEESPANYWGYAHEADNRKPIRYPKSVWEAASESWQ